MNKLKKRQKKVKQVISDPIIVFIHFKCTQSPFVCFQRRVQLINSSIHLIHTSVGSCSPSAWQQMCTVCCWEIPHPTNNSPVKHQQYASYRWQPYATTTAICCI